jgi:hypothetical protein
MQGILASAALAGVISAQPASFESSITNWAKNKLDFNKFLKQEKSALKKEWDDWTERDYEMEKHHWIPSLSHYYRDDRGGIEFIEDYFFAHPVTDLINFSFN